MKSISFILFTLLILATFPGYPQSVVRADSSYTILFVHGAWGGGHDYRQIETLLEEKGNDVFRPTMTGQGERMHLNSPDVTLETHIQDILNVVKFERLKDIVIIGHSYGGMVITGVVDRIPDKISHVIYLDAFLPEDGESLFDLTGAQSREQFTELAEEQGDGYMVPPMWPDPWPDVPHPLGTLNEPVTLQNQDKVKRIPHTYILTMDPGAETDSFSRFALRAKTRGWNYYELEGGHNVHRDIPGELADLILTCLR